jgi:hypothetical protein
MGRFKEALRVRDVAEQHGIVAVCCLECRHRSFVSARAIVDRLGDHLVCCLPLRRTACDCRAVKALPYIPLVAAH